ncbi:NADPH2:quinone reductase [Sphingomonas vulcanisoli]|uniref:NADPH2:quinone reductase n=1 Tax=Sphingomonas vulcanisoli TaxID=1658060 RepID=A0ABX0TUF6_9SPHN|nr:quinone oxidoreductase [Sphingomonas vulcanisoli]NIJ07405.1 NADPH2:quinone reductase [Sphingomonas vulcanisoli]
MNDYRLIIRATGGPEVIERESVGALTPGKGEAVVRHHAVGLNFIDTYQRSGLYPQPLPSGLGSEAAGVVEAVGEGVTLVAPGDRVAYARGRLGAYATVRTIGAEHLVKLPDAIRFEVAAGVMLKGLTADMLVGEIGEAKAGQHVLVHAAAGGMGSILVQWLKALGCIVIAHAGSAEKAAKAKALGADHAFACPLDQLAEKVRSLTDGRGVDLVLDGVGKESWAASLASTAKRGLIASYGNASGPVPPIAPLELSRAGSLFLTRPTLFDYVDTRERLEAAAARLFARIIDGSVTVEIGQTFPLADAAEAHRALEGRRTNGSTVLVP